AAYDDPLDFGRPSEQHRRSPDLACADQLTDPAGRDVLDERHPAPAEPPAARDVLAERPPPHVEAEAVEQVQIALAAAAEAERLPRGDGLCPDPAQHPLSELLCRERCELLVERQYENVLYSRVGEQLEPAL